MTDMIEQEQMSKIMKLITEYIGSDEEDEAYLDWKWAWYKDSEESRENLINEYRNKVEWVDDLRHYLMQHLMR